VRTRKPLLVRPGRVEIRHIKPNVLGTYSLLGTAMVGERVGINGVRGWQSGDYTLRVSDDGEFNLVLPNIEGSDGQLHRDRLLCVSDSDYHPGDEWFEVWRRGETDPEFTGTPAKVTINATAIAISGIDPIPLLRKQRDTAAAFHLAGPLDVFSHACSAWRIKVREDFVDGAPAMTGSASVQTTADGRFSYQRATSGSDGATIAGATLDPGQIAAIETLQVGSDAEPWRVEANLVVRTGAPTVTLLVTDGVTNYARVAAILSAVSGYPTGQKQVGTVAEFIERAWTAGDRSTIKLALEGRGRWIFGYVNDELIGVLRQATAGPVTVTPKLMFNAGASSASVTVQSMLVRQFTAFLRPTITDWRLAGAPQPSGLIAKYFSAADAVPAATALAAERPLSPVGVPAASRPEPQITHTATATPVWQPAAAGSKNFAVRWKGAVKLSLATADVKLRVKHSDGVRLWVGKTKIGDAYISNWVLGPSTTDTGASLRSHLGQSDNGWFPIIIEWFNLPDGGGGASPQIEVEYELNGSGIWTAIGDATVALSPAGIVEQHSRLDSLWELRRLVVESFGYQHRLRPKSLESGSFPGLLEIGIRVGRDTEKVLDTIDEATEAQQEIDATDVADCLLVDAAGIADPDQASQLTYEAMDIGNLGAHVFLHSDADSASDITDRPLLEQRASSLGALRATPATQVSTRPVIDDEIIRDVTWTNGVPVYGSLARFKTEAGDGVRLQLDELAIDDRTARQIMGVTWPFFPKGFGMPQLAFRQRPRGLRDVWYRMLRRQSAQAGHYQGQLTYLPGSMGSTDATKAPDGYSRLLLPPSLDQIVRVDLVVLEKGDASAKAIEVNTVAAAISLKITGAYDVTGYASLIAAGQRLMYARLTGGASSHTIQLVATIAI
jgi:hypothetical protein